MAKIYRDSYAKLNHAPIDEQEWRTLLENAKGACDKYGAEFRGDYGWASSQLKNKRPTFADIERAVELDKFRPYYKIASDNVHAGPKGAYWRLGLLAGGSDVLLAGPSNAGLEEAGRLVAISLSQLCAPLLALHGSADAIAWTRTIFEVSREAEDAFIACMQELVKDHRRSAGRRRKPISPKQRRV